MATLQFDAAGAIRKFYIEFLEAAAVPHQGQPVLMQVLQALHMLLGDGTPQVAKRAIQACLPAYRAAVASLAGQVKHTGCQASSSYLALLLAIWQPVWDQVLQLFHVLLSKGTA